MKRILAALSMFLVGFPAVAADKAAVSTEKMVLLDGSAAPVGGAYIFEMKREDGTIVVYRRTKKDVAKLVEALKADKVTDKKLLDAKYWLAEGCAKRDGSCRGDCPKSGESCQECNTGHGTYCCCRP